MLATVFGLLALEGAAAVATDPEFGAFWHSKAKRAENMRKKARRARDRGNKERAARLRYTALRLEAGMTKREAKDAAKKGILPEEYGRLLRTDLFGSDEDYGMESEFTDEFRESTGQRSGNLRARGEARRSRFGADDNGEFRFGKY